VGLFLGSTVALRRDFDLGVSENGVYPPNNGRENDDETMG
jgi:hypothetical protein